MLHLPEKYFCEEAYTLEKQYSVRDMEWLFKGQGLWVRARITSYVWASIHPVWRRCSSFPYEEYAQSSRLARQASQNPNMGSYSCANPFLNTMSPKYAVADSLVLSVSVMIAMPEMFGGSSPKASL